MAGFQDENEAAVAFLDAVDQWATLKYFPREQRAAILAELGRMIPSREALEWLVPRLLYSTSEWPGLREIRALLCTRYDAKDGIDIPVCNLPGFTPEENERRYIEEHEQRRLKEITGPVAPAAQEILAIARRQ